jgi:hypothetical protein
MDANNTKSLGVAAKGAEIAKSEVGAQSMDEAALQSIAGGGDHFNSTTFLGTNFIGTTFYSGVPVPDGANPANYLDNTPE